MLHVAGIPGDPIGDPGLSTSVPADVQDRDGAVLVIEGVETKAEEARLGPCIVYDFVRPNTRSR